MATTGIVDINKRGCLVRLLHNLAAAQGAPADGAAADALSARPSSTQFFDLRVLEDAWLKQYGVEFTWPDAASVWLYETAGSGVMTIAYARQWLYLMGSGRAFPSGIGNDTTKGYLNGGTSFGETGANLLRHAEPLLYPGACDGINIELGTYGGTNPTFNVEVFFPAPTLLLRLAEQAVADMLGQILDRLDRLPVTQTL